MNRLLLSVLVLLSFAPGIQATASPSAIPPAVAACPDRTPASVAAIVAPGCNVWAGSLLSALAFGLHLDAQGVAVADVAEYLTTAPDQSDPLLASATISDRRCQIESPNRSANGLTDNNVVPARTITLHRSMTLGDFINSDCQPTGNDSSFESDESLNEATILIVREFGLLSASIHDYQIDQKRLAGIFETGIATEAWDRTSQRSLSRIQELSHLAMDLAQASRAFLGSASRMVARARSVSGGKQELARWVAAMRRRLPSSQDLAGLPVDERVATMIAALSAAQAAGKP